MSMVNVKGTPPSKWRGNTVAKSMAIPATTTTENVVSTLSEADHGALKKVVRVINVSPSAASRRMSSGATQARVRLCGLHVTSMTVAIPPVKALFEDRCADRRRFAWTPKGEMFGAPVTIASHRSSDHTRT